MKFRLPTLKIRVKDNVKIYSDLSMQHRHGTKILTRVKVGTELHRDSGTLQFRERHIDEAHPHDEHSYTEKIINPTLGVVIEKDERLSDHRKKNN